MLEDEFEILSGEDKEGVLKAKQGAVAFVLKGTVHRFRCTEDRTGRLLLVYTPGGTEGFFREAGRPATGDGLAPPLDSDEIGRSEVAGRRYGPEVVDWSH